MSTQSSSAGFLVGKTLPGETKAIKNVTVNGNNRTVIYEDGTRQTLTKAALKEKLIEKLAIQQTVSAKRSMRTNSDGTTSVTIGGAKRGERRTYKTEAAAKAAITRHHKR